MTKTFTRDDLIRFIYKETTEDEYRAIESALLINDELFDQYQQLDSVRDILNGVRCSPSKTVINNILNYSKYLSLPTVCN